MEENIEQFFIWIAPCLWLQGKAARTKNMVHCHSLDVESVCAMDVLFPEKDPWNSSWKVLLNHIVEKGNANSERDASPCLVLRHQPHYCCQARPSSGRTCHGDSTEGTTQLPSNALRAVNGFRKIQTLFSHIWRVWRPSHCPLHFICCSSRTCGGWAVGFQVLLQAVSVFLRLNSWWTSFSTNGIWIYEAHNYTMKE